MLILASKSPRRSEILGKICDDFIVVSKDCDETLPIGIEPREAVMLLSKIKAEAVFEDYPNDVIVGSDTVVVFDNKILTKPKDKFDAFEMLKNLSKNKHWVYTGVTILNKDKCKTFCSAAEVVFGDISDDEINWYIDSEEPFDKAGSYGIQGYGCRFIKKINGDFYAVMGLPAYETYKALKEFNY